MIYLVIGLLLLGVFAFVVGYIRDRRLKKKLERGEINEMPTLQEVRDMECCGQHEVCERDSLLAALSQEIEYYDDEELDRFQGRASDDYTEEETDEFRDVLLTMRGEDVPGWVRSLHLRAVELPDGLKDEVVMIVGEQRGL